MRSAFHPEAVPDGWGRCCPNLSVAFWFDRGGSRQCAGNGESMQGASMEGTVCYRSIVRVFLFSHRLPLIRLSVSRELVWSPSSIDLFWNRCGGIAATV